MTGAGRSGARSFLGPAEARCYQGAVSIGPTPSRAPQRQLRVTCEAGSRLAVGRRPGALVQALPVVEAAAWSRGLWGTFLPERRQPSTPRPAGVPERRRDAA